MIFTTPQGNIFMETTTRRKTESINVTEMHAYQF
jgi:hypothetical protein